MDGHGLSIEGGRTEQHDVTGAYRSAWERDTGMQECRGEGRGNVDTCLSPSLPLFLPLSLPPFVWSLRLEEQSTLAFAQDDKAYRLVGRIDVAQDSIRPRLSSRERMMAPSQLRLAGHPAGNESSFRRIEETWGQTRRETNGVRTEMNLNTCKSFSSFFPRSLIKLVEPN